MPAGGRAEGVSQKTWGRIWGVGQFTVSGNNTYTGATAVNAGKMLINGQLGNTAIAVNASGLLGGSLDLAKAKASFATAISEANDSGNADQAARSAIGLANALAHEGQHSAAVGVLAIAAKLCGVQGAVEGPTAAALRDSLAVAKSGEGTLDHVERQMEG